MNKIIFLIVVVLSLVSCRRETNPIIEQVARMEKDFTKSELDSFRKLPESKAVSSMHFSYGLTIRNTVLGGTNKDTTLVNYFNSRKVTSRDDMSAILLKCFHRKLNGKSIKLDEIIAEKTKYVKLEEECKKLQRRRLERNLKYDIGDTIQVRLKINDYDYHAYPIECPNMEHWIFNDEKDLLIKGIVLKNGIAYKDIDENRFIKIIVGSVNKDVILQLRTPKPKDTLQFTLNYNILEPVTKK
jgi:hypothetical protein